MEGGVSVYFWLPFCYNLFLASSVEYGMQKKKKPPLPLPRFSELGVPRACVSPPPGCVDRTHSFVLMGETRTQPVFSSLNFSGFSFIL